MLSKFFRRGKKNIEANSEEQRRIIKENIEKRKLQLESFKKDRLFDEIEWHYIDEIQPLTYFARRPFQIIADTKVIESEFFTIKDRNFICFADLTNDPQYAEYFQKNIDQITTQFKNKEWNFVLYPNMDIDISKLNLSYFFPYLHSQAINLNQQRDNELLGNKILRFYKYNGHIQTGFIRIVQNKFQFIGKKDDEEIDELVKRFLDVTESQAYFRKCGLMPEDFDITLDDEARNAVMEIKKQLDILKENGQFFSIVPEILKMVEDASKTSPNISRMMIDKDFRILLTDYQNREIKLSHLTKSIYFLFLKHPKGVYCSDFKIYEDELFEIYKKVSYRLDMEKMRQSVAELSLPDGKALRTHISRIKSAFASEFSDFYASKYYVIGEGVRAVLLDRDLLSWEMEI